MYLTACNANLEFARWSLSMPFPSQVLAKSSRKNLLLRFDSNWKAVSRWSNGDKQASLGSVDYIVHSAPKISQLH